MSKPDFFLNGMELRDYLAAHAPAIPEWFRLASNERCPPAPSVPAYFDTAQRAEFVSLKDGQLWPDQARAEVREFYEVWRAQKDVQDLWRNHMRERKFFAWRYHYADQMMAARLAGEG